MATNKVPHPGKRTQMGFKREEGLMSRREHEELHISDGQRHSEGRFKIAHQEAMHESARCTGKVK